MSPSSGDALFIPRIRPSPTDAGLTFTLLVAGSFQCVQRVRHDRQGTRSVLGVLFDEPVYSHGQLYVAASRCSDLYRISRSDIFA